jgi:nitrite reductase/ring-hydroxylating ferredoxin subunit
LVYKICPICDTPNPRSAVVCSACGATLTGVPLAAPDEPQPKQKPTTYEPYFGETDLLEGNLRWKGGTYLLAGIVALAVLICAGTFIFAGTAFMRYLTPAGTNGPTPVATNAVPGSDPAFVTNTSPPTLSLVTVTPAPPTETASPTPTVSPTQGPCMQKVQPGDSMIAIVARCGHRSLDVIDEVVKLNNLTDASRIQVGQTIEVPWPTATFDPNLTPTGEATSEAARETQGVSVAEVQVDSQGIPIPPTATLQPGVAWHRVVKDENVINIALEYGATLKILSELNPEVAFSQCDFSQGSGGENCTVMLFEGQMIRVPAPTPVPTLSPTPSGSETPTPTPTATFNAPSALSPGDRAFFRADEIVTLRWVASGTLGPGQVYAVRVEDRTSGKVYTGATQELSFIIPEDWHDQSAARHDYGWTVSVVDSDKPAKPYFTTEPRMFTWQGREVKK